MASTRKVILIESKSKPLAVLYLRVASADQRDQALQAIDRQSRTCRAMAVELGAEIANVYGTLVLAARRTTGPDCATCSTG